MPVGEINYRDMNSDPEIIQSAYQDALKRLYATLVLQYTDAEGVEAAQKQGEAHFTAGVAIARETRDRAIALLA